MTTGTANKKYSIEPEHITSRPRLLSLLNRIRDQFSILSVKLPKSSSRYTSAIVAVHPEQNCLILDELTPSDGHDHFLKVRECTIEVFAKGQGLSFTTTLVSKGQENGIAYYKVSLPPSVYYYLQRTSYRVPLPLNRRTPFMLPSPDESLIEGEVIDLSVGGVGFRVPPTPWTEQLTCGSELPGCRLVLGPGEVLSVDVKVRYAGVDKGKKTLRLGAQFVKLSKRQQKRLERYIMTVDRERLKAASRQ